MSRTSQGRASDEALERLVDEQAALRRMATLVAEGVPSDEIFAAVSDEVGRLFGTDSATVVKYDEEGAGIVFVGVASRVSGAFPLGAHWLFQEGMASAEVYRTGRSARTGAHLSTVEGPIGDIQRRLGIMSSVASPIVVEGRLWGAMSLQSQEPLPPDTDERVEKFTELIATAIANAESRAVLTRLAEEQAALRRVATLVARGVRPDEIFAAVSNEVGRLVGTDSATVMKFDEDGPGVVFVGVASKMSDAFPLGARWKFKPGMASADVYRTGRSARSDAQDWTNVDGPVGETHRRLGILSAVASPIVVEGRRWGAMAVQSQKPLPLDTEARLERFTELLATAIANAESRAALTSLAEEQTALRRVATLVARGVRPDEIFAAVSDEVGRLIGTDSATIIRYDDDGEGITYVGSASKVSEAFPVGVHWKFQEGMASFDVYRTGRSARSGAHLSTVEGPIGDIHRRMAIVSAVASPIVVEDRLWGAMAVHGQQPLPPDTEERVEKFTELVATAIANAESRAGLSRLAEEQAALRHVATLVASGAPPAELFAAVTDEVRQLLPVTSAAMGRYDADGLFTTVAASSPALIVFPVGQRWVPEGKNVMTLVLETGRPARIDDFADASGPVGVAAREAGYRSAVGTPIIVGGRLWGVMTAASSAGQLPSDIEARLASFTELVATAIANAESSAGLARLAEEQTALRRVATLVAEGVPPARVLSALCEEVSRLIDAQAVTIGRVEPDGKIAVLAITGTGADLSALGARFEPEELPVTAAALQTGRSVRMDDYAEEAKGVLVDMGVRSGVGVPIVVEGALWGAIAIGTVRDRFPDDTEQRLEKFTQLAATAIADAESRVGLARLAEEQAALRRVATLVAEGVQPVEVFSALCEEVNQLLDAQTSAIVRLEADTTVTVVSSGGITTQALTLGTRLKPEPGWVLTAVLQTGRPARKDDYDESSGRMPGVIRSLGIQSSVGVPIVVEGKLWGVIVIGTARDRFPVDTGQRLEEFTELAATAIANAEGRSELTASRARVVAASDETRRRIERDLHDGTQQRLVSLGLALRATEAKVPPELEEVRAELSRTAGGLADAVEDLQEISRGIHPAILSRGGLAPALETLAGRAAVPVRLQTRIHRKLPESVEVAAYYIVSEALTNIAKHAQASAVHVELRAEDSVVEVAISDDGLGGADPGRGSGLLGLRDRVEALGGTIDIVSGPNLGTSVVATIPTDESNGTS